MIKFVIGVLISATVICGGSALIVNWAFSHDERNAEKTCTALGAEPHYTYRTHYICVTPDGRVVGD